MHKAGEMRSHSAGDKLPESTGDKLPTGEMVSTLLGRLLRLYLGVAPLKCLVFRRGTILDQDCRGCLLGMFVYSVGEY